MGIAEEGDPNAGIKGFSNEYLYLKTSTWTQLAVGLQHGGLVTLVNLPSIPGTGLPLGFSMNYSSLNAGVDIGVGKGWISNFQVCVKEDSGTNDLTFVTATGAKFVFAWDAGSSHYHNPKSFTGKATKNTGGTYTIQTLEGIYYQFNSDGKLTQIASKTGGIINVGYDTAGRPITMTDPLSERVITVSWSTGGKIASVSDMLGNTWSFTYSQDGNDLIQINQPSEEDPPEDIHTSFTYDGNHKMTEQVDFEGFSYGITYHTSGYQSGKVASIEEPTQNAATTSFGYEEDQGGYDKKTTVTDATSREVSYYFNDASEHLEKISQIAGATEIKATFTYNSLGLVATSKESYDKETTYSYDAVGHLVQITYPPPVANGTSLVKQFIYAPENDIDGKLIQVREKVTSTVWSETTMAYTDNDAPNSPSVVTDPLGHVTTINFNANKQPVSITQETDDGTKTTEMTYDELANLIAMLNAEGKLSTFDQNLNGMVISSTDYNGPTKYHQDIYGEAVNYDVTLWPDELAQRFGGSSVTLTKTSTRGPNGEETESTNETGCSSGSAFSTTVNNVAYMAPRGMTMNAMSDYQLNPFTFTDTSNHTTSYSYREDGSLHEQTNHLGQTTDYALDAFGRIATVTSAFGRETNYSYNLNSQVTEKEVEGVGSIVMEYNDRGEISSYTDPIEGSFTPTYNVRGDVLSDQMGTYTYDLLGRPTGTSYSGGGSDATTYSVAGEISAFNGATFSSDQLGNMTTWNDNEGSSATFGYSTYQSLGMADSMTGTNHIGSYEYSYNPYQWLYTLQDTGKNNGTFTYSWDSDGTLVGLINPGGANLTQTYTRKILDTVEVKKSNDTYLATDTTLDNQDLKTNYSFEVYAGNNNTFSESYTVAYDTLKRVSEIEKSNQETVTYGYNTTVGDVTSIDFSDSGAYSVAWDTKGRISSITYPGSQGTESYSYDDTNDQGKLAEISYPGNHAVALDWDNRDRVSSLTFDDNGVSTVYQIGYTALNKIKQLSKSEEGIPVNTWYYYYGPFGLEKAILKNSSNQTILTQDYTVDLMGKLLSMTYTPTSSEYGTYTGELYLHYDNDGDIALLTDSSGNPRASFQYDMITGNLINTWNPNGIITSVGAGGSVEIAKPWDGSVSIAGCGSITNQNSFAGVDISKKGSDLTVRGGSTDAKPCGGSTGSKITVEDIQFNPCFKENCFKDCWDSNFFGSGGGWWNDLWDLKTFLRLETNFLFHEKRFFDVLHGLGIFDTWVGRAAFWGFGSFTLESLKDFFGKYGIKLSKKMLLKDILILLEGVYLAYQKHKRERDEFLGIKEHAWIKNKEAWKNDLGFCVDECCNKNKKSKCCEIKNR
jgi:YD repeat-containing protein